MTKKEWRESMGKENMHPNTLAMIPSRMMKVPSNPIGGGGGET